jgi:hypothetical protein
MHYVQLSSPTEQKGIGGTWSKDAGGHDGSLDSLVVSPATGLRYGRGSPIATKLPNGRGKKRARPQMHC